MSVDASIVVVTHRGVDPLVRACLTAIDAAGGPTRSTVLVDNSGGPDVAAHDYGPGVAQVVRTGNRGFGAAANSGITAALDVAADAPVAVLNDDIEVDSGWLPPLLDALTQDDRLGAVQPALVYLDTGRVNSLGVELDRFGAGSDIGMNRSVEALGESMPIDVFTGGAVLFRPEFLRDTGGFDERYFLYYEDVDLALRGAERGWSYRCETASIVHHHGGATTDHLGSRRIAYQERNRLWVAARFGSAATLGSAVWLSVRRVRHEPRRAHVRALATGVIGIPGALLRRLRRRVSDTG